MRTGILTFVGVAAITAVALSTLSILGKMSLGGTSATQAFLISGSVICVGELVALAVALIHRRRQTPEPQVATPPRTPPLGPSAPVPRATPNGTRLNIAAYCQNGFPKGAFHPSTSGHDNSPIYIVKQLDGKRGTYRLGEESKLEGLINLEPVLETQHSRTDWIPEGRVGKIQFETSEGVTLYSVAFKMNNGQVREWFRRDQNEAAALLQRRPFKGKPIATRH